MDWFLVLAMLCNLAIVAILVFVAWKSYEPVGTTITVTSGAIFDPGDVVQFSDCNGHVEQRMVVRHDPMSGVLTVADDRWDA